MPTIAPPVSDENPADPPCAAPPREDFESAGPPAQKGLLLVSTPIGNLGDLSSRALAALAGADLILCEDTRHTQALLSANGIARPLTPLHDHNEEARLPGLIARLGEGLRVVLVSDAGTPLVSDPGFRLVRAAIAAGVPVSAIPGPNAAVMALTLSGLPPHPFLFLGFPPPRHAARVAAFGRLRAVERAGLAATLIWHEAPHRLAETLADLAAVFGMRPAAVARELTKRFEEVRRGGLDELAAQYAVEAARGEITIVVGPAPEEGADDEAVDARLVEAMAGMSLRDAAALVAEETGRSRGEVYKRALGLRGAAGG